VITIYVENLKAERGEIQMKTFIYDKGSLRIAIFIADTRGHQSGKCEGNNLLQFNFLVLVGLLHRPVFL